MILAHSHTHIHMCTRTTALPLFASRVNPLVKVTLVRVGEAGRDAVNRVTIAMTAMPVTNPGVIALRYVNPKTMDSSTTID